ncbi:hypothetical protein ACTFIY_005722 [Dictyostelium cf. discoideum]
MKLKMKFSIISLFIIKLVISKPILKFNNNNKFKIIQFTDLHYGSEPVDDIDTIFSTVNILDYEKPDLVILSGDMVTGYEEQFKEGDRNYWKYWNVFTRPLVERNIPWAITFGNHDGEGSLSTNEILKIDQSFDLSLSQSNSVEMHGVANYVLKISSSNSLKSEPASLVYLFDSSTKGCSKLDWGCVHQDQVDWFKNTSKSLNKTDSIAFVHIPPVEIIDLWNNYPVYGNYSESSCCFDNENGNFVPSLVESGDVHGLYFGRDHENDFHGDYKGVDLGYGRKSGAGSYSSKKQLGARVFQLTESPFTLSTWIREEDGNIVSQVIHPPSDFDRKPLQCKLKDKYSKKELMAIKVVGGFLIFLGIVVVGLIGFFGLKHYKKYEFNKQYQELKKYTNCIL